jgi:hypothetical protein
MFACYRRWNHSTDGTNADAGHVLSANSNGLRERYDKLHAPDHVQVAVGRIGARRGRADFQQVLQARRDQ